MAARLVQLRTTSDEEIYLNPTIVRFVKEAEQPGTVRIQVGPELFDRIIVYGSLNAIVQTLNNGLDRHD